MADIETLIDGYRRFYKRFFQDDSALYEKLATEGQKPKTLVIACSDSRVCPTILTDASPGDIFMIRNVANLVPPCESDSSGLHGVSAALEFAVRFLEVEHIIVMGHSGCAGIAALLEGTKQKDTETNFIHDWVNIAKEARDHALAQKEVSPQLLCEQESILVSLANLVTFSWIGEKVENKTLQLHGWHFSIEDGKLYSYDPETNGFKLIQ